MGFRVFREGILTAILLAGTAFASEPNNPQVYSGNLEQRSSISEPNIAEPNLRETPAYKAVNQVIIRDFLKDYLAKVIPKSDNFRELKKKHGEQGLLERYASAHELCLDLAAKYSGKEIPAEEYTTLGNALAKKQHETSKGVSRVNYLDKEVVKSFKSWGRLKTENFKRLLEAEGKISDANCLKEDYVASLHKSAYTPKEYRDYIAEQNKANDGLYASMKGTLNFIESFIGGGEIETIRKMTNTVYSDTIAKYFKNEP